MAVKYGKFEMPNNITVDEATMTSTFARFVAEPLNGVLVTPSAIRYDAFC